MLSLQLKSGEYLTIGDNIVVQVFQQHGSSFRVEVKAPREIPIARGTVLEREGGKRPDGLFSQKPSQPSRRVHNAKKLDSLSQKKDAQAAALRDLQAELGRETPDLAVLREKAAVVAQGFPTR